MNSNKTVTREEFESLKKEFENLKNEVMSIRKLIQENDTTTPSFRHKKKMSARETFLFYNSAKTGMDKFLVITAILEDKMSGEGFTRKDVMDCYKEVKEKPTKNLSDYFYKTEKKGYLAIHSGNGKNRRFALTNSGIKAVEKLNTK